MLIDWSVWCQTPKIIPSFNQINSMKRLICPWILNLKYCIPLCIFFCFKILLCTISLTCLLILSLSIIQLPINTQHIPTRESMGVRAELRSRIWIMDLYKFMPGHSTKESVENTQQNTAKWWKLPSFGISLRFWSSCPFSNPFFCDGSFLISLLSVPGELRKANERRPNYLQLLETRQYLELTLHRSHFSDKSKRREKAWGREREGRGKWVSLTNW